METNSRPEKEVSTSKQGQYRPRRKDTTPKVNPQLAVELVYQELKRVEVYTKRIEDATSKKVQIDGESLESAEKCLKNVLADFERQGNRMKSGGYVDKRVSFYSILCVIVKEYISSINNSEFFFFMNKYLKITIANLENDLKI